MLTFVGHAIEGDGYGYATIKLRDALQAHDPDTHFADLAGGLNRYPPAFGFRQYETPGTAVVLAAPVWWPDVTADRLVGFTMAETTQASAEFTQAAMAHSHAMIVPSPFSARAFQNAGYTKPIYTVPLGVDVDDFPMVVRPLGRQPYTFLWSGTADPRKGWDVAYGAFKRQFGDREDVRLILHFRHQPDYIRVRERNVVTINGRLSHEEYLGLLREADCFVYPSRGEGWGLQPREAAATGLPVIATDWSALSEDIIHWAFALQPEAELRPASYGYWFGGEVGNWAEPSKEHLMQLMETCVTQPDMVAGTGYAAAMWLARHNTWETTAGRLRAVISSLEGEGERHAH
jgi:glycosyltransferase involved in cell wall biosynthesis